MNALEVTDRGPVRTLAFNRPERRNALNAELLDRLPEELAGAAGDFKEGLAAFGERRPPNFRGA